MTNKYLGSGIVHMASKLHPWGKKKCVNVWTVSNSAQCCTWDYLRQYGFHGVQPFWNKIWDIHKESKLDQGWGWQQPPWDFSTDYSAVRLTGNRMNNGDNMGSFPNVWDGWCRAISTKRYSLWQQKAWTVIYFDRWDGTCAETKRVQSYVCGHSVKLSWTFSLKDGLGQ